MRHRVWLIALCLYAAAAALDASIHMIEEKRATGSASAPADLAVAFAAGLFWPLDIAARVLLVSH